MELGKIKAGNIEFSYNPLTTDVYVKQLDHEWEVEIYKYKHYQGSLEITQEGKVIITEDFDLSLKKINDSLIEVM